MGNSYLPEWLVEGWPKEKRRSRLLDWSQELGVSQQELRSALSSTSVNMADAPLNMADAPLLSERRRHAERRRDGRRRGD